MQSYVITGTGTDVGKTVVSAVLCEALHADYWKPLQSGGADRLDADFVKMHTSSTGIIPTGRLLSEPLSPHEAARIDGVELTMDDFQLPFMRRTTLIEGAGGLMVPINEDGLTYLDIFEHWKLPVYLVTRHYLGSINHTLLSLYTLKVRGIPVEGLIVSGDRNEASERVYKTHFPEISVSNIPEMETFSPKAIAESAQQWKQQVG